MIPDFPINIRIRLVELIFFLLLPNFANSLPCLLSQQNWASQQGRKLAKSGSNKKKFQFCKSYSYVYRKVWYHQIWITNNLGFLWCSSYLPCPLQNVCNKGLVIMLYYVALKAFENISSAIKPNFYNKLTFKIVSSCQILISILHLTCKSCHEVHTARRTSVKYRLHNCIGRLLMLFHTSSLTTARAKPWYYKRQAGPLVS